MSNFGELQDKIPNRPDLQLHIFHCGLKNILVFLSPTPKTNGGHENRAKSVWESSFIEILDLPLWP